MVPRIVAGRLSFCVLPAEADDDLHPRPSHSLRTSDQQMERRRLVTESTLERSESSGGLAMSLNPFKVEDSLASCSSGRSIPYSSSGSHGYM